jgi:hypothetical protein
MKKKQQCEGNNLKETRYWQKRNCFSNNNEIIIKERRSRRKKMDGKNKIGKI